MESNRWTMDAKRQLLAEKDRGDSDKAIARRYGLAVSTAKQYCTQFRAELAGNRSITDGTKKVTVNTPLANFEPEALTSARKAAGLTPNALAYRCNVQPIVIRSFERGEYGPYTDSATGGDSVADRLCRVLGIKLTDLQRKPQSVDLSSIERELSELKSMMSYIVKELAG